MPTLTTVKIYEIRERGRGIVNELCIRSLGYHAMYWENTSLPGGKSRRKGWTC